MLIHVIYFGSIAEITGIEKEILELDIASIDEIKFLFLKKYGMPLDPSVRIAVNQELNYQGIIKDGDLVAILPPFAGG